ncbi:FACT complex subunit [Emydomyces testavorans]|uniref:FACT complex subunit POB3 n=1 Tax=Emydomyces testavorans TaxID=2070801 RepID=A0AAF0IIH9_9EURO|nr:FACT complex subunit [Emydomyces testavorans]
MYAWKAGKCKLAESGLGWKPSGGGDTFTLDKSNIGAAQWSRAAKGYELKILPRTGGVIQLDGFDQEDLERTSKAFKLWYGVNLENREHALRGWNWGKADFGKAELSFNVQNRPAFEIPYSEISNTNLAGRNEVAVEFSLPTEGAANGVNGQPGSTKNRGKKAGAGKDELVEMRFYIPGTAVKEQAEGDEQSVDGEEVEEQNAANLFYETLMDKAEIGEVAGDTFATFPDVLHLTPRGRFDIDMYESSLRLRGKTYDYKIQYQSIKKFFLLPKNDDTHTLITVGLDPPLRQGQTRYPFLVMQLKLDDEYHLDLNMTEELLQTRYKDKLQAHYEEPIHQVITKVFRGLSGKKVIMPSKDFIRSATSQHRIVNSFSAPSVSMSRLRTESANVKLSHHQHSGVKCSIKANEGLLFCLDKSFMFVPKPATYIQIENISVITMSRVGGAVSTSRTFDITMTLKGGGEHQFSNINREEQQPLEDFFKAKNIRFKNEMAEDTSALLAAALDNDELMESSDEDVAGAHRGSADEDEESVDEDFQAESESDVAEEYDSAHESSGAGSGSDAGMDDAEEEAEEDVDEEARPKKKSKVEK